MLQQSSLIMGMPIVVEVVDSQVTAQQLEKIFDYFRAVDRRFSTYKSDSEISGINQGKIQPADYSAEMAEVLLLAEKTKQETDGYFSIGPVGNCDPSGIVKGWAIRNAARHLQSMGLRNFIVNAGGDIQTAGYNSQNKPWSIGIRHPQLKNKIVKTVQLSGEAIATSGNYLRGEHIHDKHGHTPQKSPLVSLTVIAADILDADRIATAAFAMGKEGISFIERMNGYDGYMIDNDGIATMTNGFEKYVKK